MKTFLRVVEAILAVIGGIAALSVGVLVAEEGPKGLLNFVRNIDGIYDNDAAHDAMFGSKRPMEIKID